MNIGTLTSSRVVLYAMISVLGEFMENPSNSRFANNVFRRIKAWKCHLPPNSPHGPIGRGSDEDSEDAENQYQENSHWTDELYRCIDESSIAILPSELHGNREAVERYLRIGLSDLTTGKVGTVEVETMKAFFTDLRSRVERLAS